MFLKHCWTKTYTAIALAILSATFFITAPFNALADDSSANQKKGVKKINPYNCDTETTVSDNKTVVSGCGNLKIKKKTPQGNSIDIEVDGKGNRSTVSVNGKGNKVITRQSGSGNTIVIRQGPIANKVDDKDNEAGDKNTIDLTID